MITKLKRFKNGGEEKVDLDVLSSTCPFINFIISNIVSPLIMLGMGMIGVTI
jgi:hypothetical protein